MLLLDLPIWLLGKVLVVEVYPSPLSIVIGQWRPVVPRTGWGHMTIYFAIFEYVVFRTWGSSASEELQDCLCQHLGLHILFGLHSEGDDAPSKYCIHLCRKMGMAKKSLTLI